MYVSQFTTSSTVPLAPPFVQQSNYTLSRPLSLIPFPFDSLFNVGNRSPLTPLSCEWLSILPHHSVWAVPPPTMKKYQAISQRPDSTMGYPWHPINPPIPHPTLQPYWRDIKIKYVTKPYADPNAHNIIEYRNRLLIKSESLDTCSHKT